VHGLAFREIGQLHKLFHQMKMELKQHLITEKEIVFPLIQKVEQVGAQADLPIVKRNEGDHRQLPTAGGSMPDVHFGVPEA
jgi:iron-sulfur cluster repair protein YtfE (RIC family)